MIRWPPVADLDDPKRLSALQRALVAPGWDPVLEELVRDASTAAAAPIALVTLVGEKVQIFRAHVGLPPELLVSRATSRDASVCQFVVSSNGSVVVEDALREDWVPQELIDRYGLRAYAGVPIRSGDQVVGSLCVLDVEPRAFPPETHARLVAIAERVSARCTELGGVIDDDAPDSVAGRLTSLERRLVELLPLVRLAVAANAGALGAEELRRGVASLAEPVDSYQEILAEVRSLRDAVRGMGGSR